MRDVFQTLSLLCCEVDFDCGLFLSNEVYVGYGYFEFWYVLPAFSGMYFGVGDLCLTLPPFFYYAC